MELEAVPGQLNLLGELNAEEPQSLEVKEKVDIGESAPQTLLIIDTETSGLEPEEHHCLELGAILIDIPSRQILAQI